MNDPSLGPYQVHGSQVRHLIVPDPIIEIPTFQKPVKLADRKAINKHYTEIKGKKELPPRPSTVDLQKLYYSKEFVENNGKVDPTKMDFCPHEVKKKKKFGEKISQMILESKWYSSVKKSERNQRNRYLPPEERFHIPNEFINIRTNGNAGDSDTLELEKKQEQLQEIEAEFPCNMVDSKIVELEKKEEPLKKLEEDSFTIWPEFDNEDDKFEFLKEKLEKLQTR